MICLSTSHIGPDASPGFSLSLLISASRLLVSSFAEIALSHFSSCLESLAHLVWDRGNCVVYHFRVLVSLSP
jgi:hypothetical protein